MCLDNFCYPGSKCVSDYPRYECICNETRVGLLCEHENPCINSKCIHGKCNPNLNGTFTCSCNNGFQGYICNEDINECLVYDNICGKLSCINTVGGYYCQKNQTNLVNCDLNNCENGGTCLKQFNNDKCVCLEGNILKNKFN